MLEIETANWAPPLRGAPNVTANILKNAAVLVCWAVSVLVLICVWLRSVCLRPCLNINMLVNETVHGLFAKQAKPEKNSARTPKDTPGMAAILLKTASNVEVSIVPVVRCFPSSSHSW